MFKYRLKEIEVGEVKVYGYQTQHFDICPGAQSLYKKIVSENLVDDEDLVIRSAKMHDALFSLEKNALKRGANALDVETAQLLADQIMAMAKMMNLESEHQYVQGHVDRIKEVIINEIKVGDTDIKKGVKTTVSDVDPETGAITYDVESVADFSTTYKELEQAKKFLRDLEQTGKAKDDTTLDKLADEISSIFNKFRTHIRKTYPEEYERVLRLKENVLQGPKTKEVYKIGDTIIYQKDDIARSGKIKDFDYHVNDDSDNKEYIVKKEDIIGLNLEEQSSTSQGGFAAAGGSGAQYATPFAFKKKGKKGPSIYYYKLGFKPVPKIKPKSYDIKQLFEFNDMQKERINSFDEVEKKVNAISTLLSNAKNETVKYYNENPGSYGVVYSTDMISSLLDDITSMLKQSE